MSVGPASTYNTSELKAFRWATGEKDTSDRPRVAQRSGLLAAGRGNGGYYGDRGRGCGCVGGVQREGYGWGVWWCGDGSGGRGERGRFGLAVLR